MDSLFATDSPLTALEIQAQKKSEKQNIKNTNVIDISDIGEGSQTSLPTATTELDPALLLQSYVKQPTVSVIVNALPDEHFSVVAKELSRLKKIYNAQLGQVIVLGLAKSKAEHKQKRQEDLITKSSLQKVDFDILEELIPQEKLLKELGFTEYGNIDFEKLRSAFQVSISPTWIVQYHDKKYIYEGINNPSKLFTSKGTFRNEEQLKNEKVRGTDFFKEKLEKNFEQRITTRDYGKLKKSSNWDATLYLPNL
ncbi:MAG: hypothetical protein LBE20_01900 [Deltaproteobacteria bacterium]|nr:hypothetical protein [Deltaproteobacteria bacterium]